MQPLPDLRSLRPRPGRPPTLPFDDKPDRAQRKQRSAHRKAVAEWEKVSRRDPLPPDVWIVRADSRFAVLRVPAPGRVELWHGENAPVQTLQVARTTRGWWRGARLTLRGPQGGSYVVRTVEPGTRGLVDLGRADSTDTGLDGGGGDVLDLLVYLLVLLVFLYSIPRLIRAAVRRRRVRNQIARAVAGAAR